MTNTSRCGADLFFETLKMWGIERVYICPGTTEATLLDASLRHTEVQLVLVTHESVAVAAADGEARVTGRPTAVFLHTNVGLTNGLSHLYAADVAYSPVVIFNGIKPQSIQGRYAFTHSRNNRDFVKPYVRWEWQNLSTEDIGEDTHRAIQAAVSPPGGPTFLALSQDLLAAPVTGEARRPHTSDLPRARPEEEAVGRAVSALLGAKRPRGYVHRSSGCPGWNVGCTNNDDSVEVSVIMRALDPEVMDAMWAAAEPLLPCRGDDHPLGCHNPRIADRVCFEGILIRLVTGCSWVTAERLMAHRASATLRARRDEWVDAGVFDALADEALRVAASICSAAPVDRGKSGWRFSQTATASRWAGPPTGRTATTSCCSATHLGSSASSTRRARRSGAP